MALSGALRALLGVHCGRADRVVADLMTHYSRTWNCWVCAERQETTDTPRMQVCEECLAPVAHALCKRALGVDLDTGGVDREYWMRKASAIVSPMMRRRREPASV